MIISDEFSDLRSRSFCVFAQHNILYIWCCCCVRSKYNNHVKFSMCDSVDCENTFQRFKKVFTKDTAVYFSYAPFTLYYQVKAIKQYLLTTIMNHFHQTIRVTFVKVAKKNCASPLS